MIRTNIESLRDPFLIVEDDAYYIYGTGVTNGDWGNTMWDCYKNTSGKLDGEWKKLDHNVAVLPEDAEKNRWAPEVHKYNGSYYMFTTYHSSSKGHKGCTILKSESPEGPFVEITGGIITPDYWDCIDGTLYIDNNGEPWMVYVVEWGCTGDGIGKMAASKMSKDLTHFVSEPIVLFKANEPSWATKEDSMVTDGCFMYRCANGDLLMTWSNFVKEGYCVALSKSDNGRLDGKWSHSDTLLFSKSLSGEHGGGHGMVFTARDGKMYLCLHTPNHPTPESCERTVFVPIYEENGTLVTVFD